MKKMLCIVLSVLIICFFTGCSSKELDRLAIVTSIQIEKKSDKMTVYAEILDMGTAESPSENSAMIISVSGNDISDCLEKLDATESRDIYLGHMRIMILGTSYLDDISQKELTDIASYALENNEIRFNVLIAAADDSDDIVIQNKTTGSQNRGIDLSQEIRKNTYIFDIRDMINCITYYENIAALPVIETVISNDVKYASISPDRYYRLSTLSDTLSGNKEIS